MRRSSVCGISTGSAGNGIWEAVRRAGITERRIAGLRVTDAATLDITERVLCASVNKALVRAFATCGVRAVGISGQDGRLITATPLAPIEGESLGFVGEVAHVDPTVVRALLDAGFVPVIAPLGLSEDAGTRYNLNADTAAGAIAGALSADPYVVVTDVPRVRRDPRDPASGIDELTRAESASSF